MKVLVIGATGATGQDLVEILLRDQNYTEVITFVRRAGATHHPKLKEVITDFDALEKISELIKGDVLFCCLGTTLKAAGSKEKQTHIDYEIPARFAQIARTNGVAAMVLLSAYGASASSSVFYSRLKGRLEEAIAALQFEKFIIFRPGLLLRKNTDRAGERVIGAVLNFLSRVGLVRRFKPLPTSVLAEKLAKAPVKLGPGTHTISLNKIFDF